MSNNRKGVELAMNTMVVTVLALLVLAILAIFIIKSFRNTDNYNKCETQGGQCVGIKDACPSNLPVIGGYGCSEKDRPKCCTNPLS